MLRNVILHGDLVEKFGPCFRYDVATPGEAGRALNATLEGFGEHVRDKWYRIVRGDPEKGLAFDGSELGFELGSETDIHVIPVAAGSKGKGGAFSKIVLGAMFIALSVVTFGAGGVVVGTTMLMTTTEMIMFGAGLILTGVSMMLAPSPQTATQRERPEARASFLFNAPINRSEEGGVVPLGYGRFRIGSVLLSGSLQIEKLL